MNDLTPAFAAAARASSQTTFETSDRAPDAVALFITDVEDAPLQIIGQLGSDGRWYIGSFAVAPLDKDPDQLTWAKWKRPSRPCLPSRD